MAQRIAHADPQILVETAQDILTAHDLRYLGAQTRENAGEFDRYIPAANDQHMLRQGRKIEDLVRGDSIVPARDVRLENRRAARGDENVARTDFPPIREEVDCMRVQYYRTGIYDRDTRLVEIGPIDAREAGNLLFLRGNEFRPIEGSILNCPAEPLRIGKIIGETACIDHQLFRHATANDAGAANPKLFRNHDLGAIASRDPRRTYTARSRADDKEINIETGHRAYPMLQNSNFMTKLLHLDADARHHVGRDLGLPGLHSSH